MREAIQTMEAACEQADESLAVIEQVHIYWLRLGVEWAKGYLGEPSNPYTGILKLKPGTSLGQSRLR